MVNFESLEQTIEHLKELGVRIETPAQNSIGNQLLVQLRLIDSLAHDAYKAIESNYQKLHPELNPTHQVERFKNIINIKAQLRSLECLHIELTKELRHHKRIYVSDESNLSLISKYLVNGIEKESIKDILTVNYYQLLDKIQSESQLQEQDIDFISSLLMQLISRPQGQKLILKLNYLLEKKDAILRFRQGREFACCSDNGNAQENLEKSYLRVAPNTNPTQQFFLRYSMKMATIKTSKKVTSTVLLDMNYLHSDSFLNTDCYASPRHGLTDMGPPVVLLAHELIHATHQLKGVARSNFKSFYHCLADSSDNILSSVYPKRNQSVEGDGAEEYWTIEVGKLSENSIREEHGLSQRTGHVSSEPGCREIWLLYYAGFCQSQLEGGQEAYQSHVDDLEGLTEEEMQLKMQEDAFIKYSLKQARFLKQSISQEELVKGLAKLQDRTFRRAKLKINQWAEGEMPASSATEQEKRVSLFSIIPHGLAKTLYSIFACQYSGDVLNLENVDSDVIESAMHNLNNLVELFESPIKISLLDDHQSKLGKLNQLLANQLQQKACLP